VLSDKWVTYQEWNEAVAAVIYPFVDDSRPVYMDLPDKTLQKIADEAGHAGDPKAGLVAAVRACVATGSEFWLRPLVRRQMQWFEEEPDEVPPPCLAYLAVTVLAAEEMGSAGSGLAHNAYYPRLARILDVGEDGEAVRGQYSTWAEYLWRSVNRWLERLEGARGLPTAYALSFRYVGLPISQALVREADRQRFPPFFAQYGLAPGAEVSPNDIEPFMGAWIADTSSSANGHLRSVWHSGGRERLAGIAAVELANWDGVTGLDDPSVVETSNRALVLANMRSGFMGSSLELSLSVQPRAGLPDQRLEVLAEDGKWLPVTFAPAAAGRWRTHESANFDVFSVLEGTVRLREPGGHPEAPEFTRHPRPLVPLVFDESQSAYVEQERPQLGVDCLILVRATGRAGKRFLADEVESVLGTCARPGFSRATDLDGVPQGWVLFRDVQLFRSPASGRFNELIPLARNQLTLAGGLRIPSRIRKWSTLKPPEIRAVIQSENAARVELAEADSASREILASWSTDDGALVAPLENLGLDDGDFVVSLFEGDAKTPLQQATLRLRSADTPDPGWALTTRLTYSMGGDNGPIGALTASEGFDEPLVDGALAVGDNDVSPTLAADSRVEWNEERPQPVRSTAIKIGEVSPDSCVVTGAHYFVFPTWYGGRPSKFIEGTCAYCGMAKRQPGWAPPKGGGGARGRWKKQEVVASVADLEPVDSELLRPWDAALDAVMHLGGGDIASLHGIAQQLEGTALFTSQFVRTLESLAHVAVERDESGHPVRWEISPRSLAERSDGGWELVGFWPPSAVGELVAGVEAAGGDIEVKSAEDAPTSMSLWDVRLDDLESVQEQEVLASPAAGSSVLGVLPRLSVVADALGRMPLPGFDSAERFVASSASWVSVSHCVEAGAYRIRRGFEVIYQFANDHDVSAQQAARVSPYLAKYLEANRVGVRLVTYYPDREALVVPRGAELPGLYGRALVLMTGQLPKPMVLKQRGYERKCLAYEGVGQADADALVTLLNT
jgi:hypothetical protein